MIEKNITTNENLVQDISNELIFGHTHNGVKCAVCPTAKRACDRAWFSAKQIEEWSEMSTKTLWRRLNELEEVGRICSVSDMKHCKMPTNNGGYQDVQLYNLNVLNQLAMVELDCPVLNDTAKKFSDILSEVETTGSYSVNQQQAQPMRTLPHDYESALEALLTEVRKNKALQAELYETKVLLAKEKAYYELLSEVVDKFTHTNTRVNGKKVASDLGTDGAESKESEEVRTTARDWCLKHQLPIYAIEPKRTVSELLTDICEARPDREQWYRNASGTLIFPKWACGILDKVYENNTFLLEYRTE